MNVQILSEDVAFVGPPLSAGPLPTLFYFSLSAEESLSLDPFNQPVVYLAQKGVRIFSVTLPGHEHSLPAKEALHRWAEHLKQGHDIVLEFVKKVENALKMLQEKGCLLEGKLAVAGLSRGAFMATHIAAHLPLFTAVLGFAPLTELHLAKEFHTIKDNPLVRGLQLKQCASRLIHHPLRFYIGNLDTRVHTRSCFDFIETLAQAALQHQVRSPQVELIISPSIGKDGHGTSQEIFHQGAEWIAQLWSQNHGM